jgi:hypothetical protein
MQAYPQLIAVRVYICETRAVQTPTARIPSGYALHAKRKKEITLIPPFSLRKARHSTVTKQISPVL